VQHRGTETHHSFASSHEDAMEFPTSGPSPAAFPDPIPEMTTEEPTVSEPASVATTRPAAEVISLETMRSAMVASFEQEDLDVPAFLRKRNEVM
jgi:hypothetical protein